MSRHISVPWIRKQTDLIIGYNIWPTSPAKRIWVWAANVCQVFSWYVVRYQAFDLGPVHTQPDLSCEISKWGGDIQSVTVECRWTHHHSSHQWKISESPMLQFSLSLSKPVEKRTTHWNACWEDFCKSLFAIYLKFCEVQLKEFPMNNIGVIYNVFSKPSIMCLNWSRTHICSFSPMLCSISFPTNVNA